MVQILATCHIMTSYQLTPLFPPKKRILVVAEPVIKGMVETVEQRDTPKLQPKLLHFIITRSSPHTGSTQALVLFDS